eukprot:GHVP01000400.1.p1 GENE.GHVP01000400.1~~GHVP01000400.1.p1  ORF type:complete len:287 (-),score=56.36 GHVP01000400.1:951-1811(-)
MNLALEDRILQQQSSEHSVVSQAGRMFEKFSKNFSTKLGSEAEIPSRITSDCEGKSSDFELLRSENQQLSKKLAEMKKGHKETLRKKELCIAHLSQTVNRLQSNCKPTSIKSQVKPKASEIGGQEIKELGLCSKFLLGKKFLTEPNILLNWINNSLSPKESRRRSCSGSRTFVRNAKVTTRSRSHDSINSQEIIHKILRGVSSSITNLVEENKMKLTEKIKSDEEITKSFKETIDRQAQQIHGLGKELAGSRSLLEEKRRSLEVIRELKEKLEASEALCCRLQVLI